MEICANCAAKLDPSWKFCITCGTAVPAAAAHLTGDEHYVVEVALPAAGDPTASTGKPASTKSAAARKPRRAQSNFASARGTAPIVVVPAATVASEKVQAEVHHDAVVDAEIVDDPIVEPAATTEYVLTPESARAEPSLPGVVLHGSDPLASARSRHTQHDQSRLGHAWSEYARAERAAAEAPLATHDLVEPPAPAAALADSVFTEPVFAELAASAPVAPAPTAPAPVVYEVVSPDSEVAAPVPPKRTQSRRKDAAPVQPKSGLTDAGKSPLKAAAASAEVLETVPFVEEENPFSHNLPPRPEQPKTRAEAKAAAVSRAATRARTTAEAKAEIRAKYPITSAAEEGLSFEYTEDNPAAFRTSDESPTKRKIDVPLIVSIGLSTTGVILIVYLAILVFGARG